MVQTKTLKIHVPELYTTQLKLINLFLVKKNMVCIGLRIILPTREIKIYYLFRLYRLHRHSLNSLNFKLLITVLSYCLELSELIYLKIVSLIKQIQSHFSMDERIGSPLSSR